MRACQFLIVKLRLSGVPLASLAVRTYAPGASFAPASLPWRVKLFVPLLADRVLDPRAGYLVQA